MENQRILLTLDFHVIDKVRPFYHLMEWMLRQPRQSAAIDISLWKIVCRQDATAKLIAPE